MKFIDSLGNTKYGHTIFFGNNMFMSETIDGLISLNSALASGIGTTFASLLDVTIAGVGADHTLRYDAGSAKWLNTGNFKVSSTGKAHVGIDSTQAGETSIYGLSVSKDVLNGGGVNGFAFAGEIVAIDSSNDISGSQHIAGLQTAAVATSAINYHELWGIHPYSLVSIGGTSDLAIGTYTQTAQTSGILDCGVGAEVYVIRYGGTMNNAIGLAVGYHSTHDLNTQGFNAVATNQYGIKVGPIVSGTTNYAWYSEAGQMQIGDSVSIGRNVSPLTNARLLVSGPVPALSGFSQGVSISPTLSSGTTAGGFGITLTVGTEAASFTTPNITGILVGNVVKGSGSSITEQYGIKVSDQTQGGTNYAISTGLGLISFGDVVNLTGSLKYISFGGVSQAYLQVDSTPQFIFSVGGTTRVQLTGSVLSPTASQAASYTLGSSALPWGNTYIAGLLVQNAASGPVFASIGTDGGAHGNLKLGRIDGVTSTPHIDFNSSSAPVSYDARFIVSSGTGSTGGGFMQNIVRTYAQVGDEDRLDSTTNAHREFYIGGARKAGLSVIASDIIRFTDSAGTVKLQYNMGGTTGKFIPPSTNLSFRNNADTQDNLLISDDATVTLANQLKFIASNPTSLGTHDNFGLSFKTNALVRFSIDTSGNILADTTNGGYITYRAGTSSATAKSTGVLFENNNAITTSTTTATLLSGSSGPASYVLKANTLINSGDSLRITYLGYVSATTGTFTLTASGTVINAVALSSNGTFAITTWITRRDATHIDWTYQGLHFNAANVTDLNRSNNVTLNLGMDQTINFQGSAAAGTLTAQLCQIVHEPAP